ncbi:MAG TPA: hypothetical protein PK668_11365 [Myxococcota bacterium]|nr:hypothetical protein [Myxococcota bacterium]HRY93235.1 hypothetical protein [Myxococcota bacterium]HSA21036.1 hypothetical protein [Myxococcota bacterium]
MRRGWRHLGRLATWAVLLLALGATPAGAAGPAGPPEPALRAELRGNDGRQPVFRVEYRSPVHFLLFSNQDGLRVFQEWCSWGYFTRSFSARQVGGAAREFVLRRNPNQAWTKNFPATHSLDRGAFLITSADLCDGSWIAEPALPLEDLELELVGHFEIKPDEETVEQKVWTGRLSTRPLTAILGRDCVEVLNRRR